jgi:excisionase family DNA binding protein
MEDELLTIPEVASIMKVTRKAVYDMMRAKRLPYVQLGISRGRRIRRSALNAFLSGADRGLNTEGESGYTKGQRKSPRLATLST